MAAPKVFISSTCYDLREIRDSLYAFVKSFGFDPVLSEHGDVFYHPDLHSHEACVYEVGNCQLFILIIGGRFGGRYVVDKEKSVTNAEYDAAVKSGIPIFTYIKKNVLENHHFYQVNKDKPHIEEFDFPAIEKKSDMHNIFSFINRVRSASINNAYEGFEVSRDIENHLRKQWASMYFDFLKSRDTSRQISQTTEVVSDLKLTSDRLEALVKEVYRAVDKEHASKNIEIIERKSNAREFLDRSVSEFIPGYIALHEDGDLARYASVNPQTMTWDQYLVALGIVKPGVEMDDGFDYMVPDDYTNEEDNPLFSSFACGFFISKSGLVPYQQETARLYENGICTLSEEERYEILGKYARRIRDETGSEYIEALDEEEADDR